MTVCFSETKFGSAWCGLLSLNMKVTDLLLIGDTGQMKGMAFSSVTWTSRRLISRSDDARSRANAEVGDGTSTDQLTWVQFASEVPVPNSIVLLCDVQASTMMER